LDYNAIAADHSRRTSYFHDQAEDLTDDEEAAGNDASEDRVDSVNPSA
jgi:hypothetical protein